MRVVEILGDFDGYPDGVKTTFRVGETSNLPSDYADMLIEKGLAKQPATTIRKPGAAKKEEKHGSE